MYFLNKRGASAIAATLGMILFPLLAAAQAGTTPPPPPGPPSQGPGTVERIKSGFLAAPDFKVTEFNHEWSPLVGGYAGWLSDRTFFIGGGGYWLADDSHNREMAYGGAVVGFFVHGDRRISFGAKGLIGGGSAELLVSTAGVFRGHDDVDRRLITRPGTTLLVPSVRVHDDFFVAEPEATVSIGLTRHVRIAGGVGFRLVAGTHGTQDQIQGTTGSVSVQFGNGF